jgi:hypothetical protein
MTDGESPGPPVFRALETPRPPTAAQLRLLSWLAAGAGEELNAQLAHCEVTGRCTCGCSSVELATSAAPLPAELIGRLSARGRLDYISLASSARSSTGHRVDVVLHVVQGLVHELEIFDSAAGEGTAVDPAELTSLDRPDVG